MRRRIASRFSLVAAAAASVVGLLGAGQAQASYYWTPTSGTNDWFTPNAWASADGVFGTPTSADTTWIGHSPSPRWDGGGGDVTLSGVAATSDMYSAQGNLTINAGGALTLKADGTGTYELRTNASLPSRSGFLTLNGGTLTGRFTVTTAAKTQALQINSGTINAATNSGLIANFEGTGTWGVAKQSGGTLNAAIMYLAYGTATSNAEYTISGGTLNVTNGLYIGNASPTGTGSGTLRIIGSASTISAQNTGLGATGLSMTGTGHTQFVLDNSARHITTITAAGGATTGGELKLELNGGVMLSGTNAFNLITVGPGRAVGGSFATTTAPLFTTAIIDSNKTLAATLDKGSQGTLDANGVQSLSFSPASFGFVNLANVNLTQPLTVSLDVTGGTLSTFTDALTGAGITWAPGSGIYDVQMTLNPATSGGTLFAWDLSTIDPSAGISAVSIAVPEPASLALLALGGLAMLRRRR